MKTNTPPAYKSNRANTYHRDGTVSYYSSYSQAWERQPAENIPDHELACMTADERRRIEKNIR